MSFNERPPRTQYFPSFLEVLSKAAPRFELGIKDLQSSALPLGHAAAREQLSPSVDRISHAPGSLLFLCNGHGEDLITLRIIQAVHRRAPRRPLTVLPLVGAGRVFDAAVQQGWLTRLGPKAALPSGGFSNQSLRGLLATMGWRSCPRRRTNCH